MDTIFQLSPVKHILFIFLVLTWNSACASATRIRQPPESADTGVSIILAENCSPRSTPRARSGAPAAPMASSCSYMFTSAAACSSDSPTFASRASFCASRCFLQGSFHAGGISEHCFRLIGRYNLPINSGNIYIFNY